MSIQASINQALGSVELALLRTGTVPTVKRDYAEEGGTEAPTVPEAKKTAPEGTNGTAEQQTSQNEAPEAVASPVADILTKGNETAAEIAKGRVEAQQQIRRKEIEKSRARLSQLMAKGKSPGSKAARAEKKKISRLMKEGS